MVDEYDENLEENAAKFISEVKQECKEFLGYKVPLYRAVHDKKYPLTLRRHTRTDRKSADSSASLSRAMNELYTMLGSPVKRENSIYTYVTLFSANNFRLANFPSGTERVIFPIGEFDSIFSPEIYDATDVLQNDYSGDLGEIMSWSDYYYKIVDAYMIDVLADRRNILMGDKIVEWQKHFYDIAAKEVEETDMNDSDKATYAYSKAKTWLQHYEKIINKKVDEELAEWKASDQYDKYKDGFLKTSKFDQRYVKHKQYDAEQMLHHFGKSFSIDFGDAKTLYNEDVDVEVLIKSDEYYSVDLNYFQIFLKDKLFPGAK